MDPAPCPRAPARCPRPRARRRGGGGSLVGSGARRRVRGRVPVTRLHRHGARLRRVGPGLRADRCGGRRPGRAVPARPDRRGRGARPGAHLRAPTASIAPVQATGRTQRAQVALSRPGEAFATIRSIGPAARPSVVRALDVNARGDAAALVVAGEGRDARPYLVVSRAGRAFGRPVRLSARGRTVAATVAVNARGDALAVWERPVHGTTGRRDVYARIRTAGGRLGAARNLGSAVTIPTFSAALGDRRRAVVAWMGQRVSEGYALGPGDDPGRRHRRPRPLRAGTARRGGARHRDGPLRRPGRGPRRHGPRRRRARGVDGLHRRALRGPRRRRLPDRGRDPADRVGPGAGHRALRPCGRPGRAGRRRRSGGSARRRPRGSGVRRRVRPGRRITRLRASGDPRRPGPGRRGIDLAYDPLRGVPVAAWRDITARAVVTAVRAP